MSELRALVLDANILIRAVLGQRVRNLLKKYAGKVRFYAPDVCFLDAQRLLPTLLQTDEIDSGMDLLKQISLGSRQLIQPFTENMKWMLGNALLCAIRMIGPLWLPH